MSNLVKLLFVLAFILFCLIAGPWCLIWAVNTLVAAGGVATFAIPFTFWTWLAAVIVGGFTVLPSVRRS